MSQQIPFDPFAIWKQMYDKAEEQWNQTLDETMHKEEFSKLMGQSLNGYLHYQNLAQKSTEKYLEQANMPSRQDLSNVASIVISVEDKVDKLEQTIEENVLDRLKQFDLTKEVQSLKSDVSNISKRLDQLFELLQSKQEVAASKATNIKNNQESNTNKK